MLNPRLASVSQVLGDKSSDLRRLKAETLTLGVSLVSERPFTRSFASKSRGPQDRSETNLGINLPSNSSKQDPSELKHQNKQGLFADPDNTALNPIVFMSL